jgi:hypothetical protein
MDKAYKKKCLTINNHFLKVLDRVSSVTEEEIVFDRSTYDLVQETFLKRIHRGVVQWRMIDGQAYVQEALVNAYGLKTKS